MDFFLIWVIPALILGGLGALLLVATTKHINRCKEVAGWSKTTGTVDSASVEAHRSQRFNRARRRGYNRTTYEPKIAYSYLVMGSTFHSSAYQNFNGTYFGTSQEKAAGVVAAYPAGKNVTVTYDPNNPSDAYLIPQTSTDKLVKSRTGQLIMIVIAVVWVGIGAVINLTSILGEKASDARIKKSDGLIPYSAQDINLKLDPLVEKYQLICNQEGATGYTLVYAIRACRADAGDDVTSFEVFARKDSPETVDMISAVFTPSDPRQTITFFNEVAMLALGGDDLKSAQVWIAEKVTEVAAGEGDTATVIGSINLALDNLGGTVRLNIGRFQ